MTVSINTCLVTPVAVVFLFNFITNTVHSVTPIRQLYDVGLSGSIYRYVEPCILGNDLKLTVTTAIIFMIYRRK